MNLSRRAFALSAAALALVGKARAGDCQWPVWADQLHADLDKMAEHLIATVTGWNGPRRVLTPEAFGYDGAGLATQAIQAAIDAAAIKGGGTIRLAKGDYVSGTIDLRDNIRLEIADGSRLIASLDMADYPERVAKRPTVQDSNMA